MPTATFTYQFRCVPRDWNKVAHCIGRLCVCQVHRVSNLARWLCQGHVNLILQCLLADSYHFWWTDLEAQLAQDVPYSAIFCSTLMPKMGLDYNMLKCRSPNPSTILTVLRGCNNMKRLKKIHAYAIVSGLQHHPYISNGLLNFCAVSVAGSMTYAQHLFHHMYNPSTTAWNSIIRGFSQSSSPLQALHYYNAMISSSVSLPNTYIFSFVLKACEKVKDEKKCREVHGSIIRRGYERDVIVCTNLMRSYAGNELIDIARRVFNDMSDRDLVSWNCMLSCYSQAGFHQDALTLYYQMRDQKVGLDGFTLVGLVASCAHIGALNIGIQMHKIARKKGFINDIYVANALIDMYAKCGSLDSALSIFNKIRKKDVLTWNSMIVGYGIHGQGDKAISLFKQMLMAKVRPTSITFLGLLCGCSHQGLVEEGIQYFNLMSSQFNLKPELKHYGCIVDLFARAGQLMKAFELIQTSPFDHPVLWRTLLSSCKIHKDVMIGEIAMKNLVRIGTPNAGDYVLMATLYAEAKNIDGVLQMRQMLKSQGIKTTVGWSWIEVGEQIHKFVVDDNSHPDFVEIYDKLKEMTHRAALLGYVQEDEAIDTDLKSSTSYHSEKLAIAFGLVKTPAGSCLRIMKNLRVCSDCHTFIKLISKAFDREIIVRDRVRFHHFSNGSCSCGDYW
ncbi:pentatricopeptide repeat-containing protein [Senna tora]|uniref:Pentatricopeptide repeat-containing protein n=1 Tax=Senna tora TaxID=362788 RepID=A0A835CJJ2_9FABA|nr:pentatricopeptide repeat-containing protein [Senna tora]